MSPAQNSGSPTLLQNRSIRIGCLSLLWLTAGIVMLACGAMNFTGLTAGQPRNRRTNAGCARSKSGSGVLGHRDPYGCVHDSSTVLSARPRRFISKHVELDTPRDPRTVIFPTGVGTALGAMGAIVVAALFGLGVSLSTTIGPEVSTSKHKASKLDLVRIQDVGDFVDNQSGLSVADDMERSPASEAIGVAANLQDLAENPHAKPNPALSLSTGAVAGAFVGGTVLSMLIKDEQSRGELQGMASWLPVFGDVVDSVEAPVLPGGGSASDYAPVMRNSRRPNTKTGSESFAIGSRCESKDVNGQWWEIKITACNKDGSYQAALLDNLSAKWDKVWPRNCRPINKVGKANQLIVGTCYESQDAKGTWREIEIIKRRSNGSYSAKVVGCDVVWEEVWPVNCRATENTKSSPLDSKLSIGSDDDIEWEYAQTDFPMQLELPRSYGR